MTRTWQQVDEARYDEMLNVLPPAVWDRKGFLVGEPWTHQLCSVSGVVRAAYTAFVHLDGRYFECLQPVTLPEFRALDRAAVTRETQSNGARGDGETA